MNLSMALANHSHDTLSFAQPSPLCQSFCWSLESIPCVRRGHWIGIPLARLRTRLQLSEKSDRAVLVRGSRPGCRLHLRVSAFRRDTADGPLRWPRLLRGDSRGGLTTSDAGTVHLIIGGRIAGSVPCGYDADPQTKQLVVNKNESGIVKWMFEAAAGGQLPAAIADTANGRGGGPE